MASSSKRLKSDDGPKPMTIFVLEEVITRKYANGDHSFGTTWMLSSDSNYQLLKQVIVHEKHLKMIGKLNTFLIVKYTLLDDGTVKLEQQTVVMQAKKPNSITEEVIFSFVRPPVVKELGRIGSFENKKRISVKGEVIKVSSVIEGSKSRRKVVTLSDGQASVDVKLWGGLFETVILEGTSIEVTCVHVDLYQNKRSLNSTGGTEIKITDVEEDFSGRIEGVSFDESCLAIFVNGEVLTCSPGHLDSLFPTHEFINSICVKGKKRGTIVTSVEEEIQEEQVFERQVAAEQEDEEPLDDSLLL